jgi:hypothetical protein
VAGADDPRDWGVPVLYLQDWDGVVFPEQAADANLEKEREALRERRTTIIGTKIGKMTSGTSKTTQEFDTVPSGTDVIGTSIDEVSGGTSETHQKFGSVSGNVTGTQLGSTGQPTADKRASPPARPAPGGPTCPNCHRPVEADWKFCANCRTPLPEQPKYCTQCGAELAPDARFCARCRAKVG